MPAGRVSCLARNERSSGEESRSYGIAAQAIEAQPVFGQIKPREARCSRAEQQPREKAWLNCGTAFKRLDNTGAEKESIAWKREAAPSIGMPRVLRGAWPQVFVRR
jgi:hypothetical protein